MGRNARNAEYIKQYNRKLFLRLLRGNPLSRAQLARRSGLTRASASLIADELMRDGLVEELPGTATKRGRTPTPLTLRAGAFYAGAVYLNRAGCQVGIVDLGDGVVCQRSLVLEHAGREKLDILARTLEELLAQSGIDRAKLVGIGISAPGPLDGESGRILNPPRFDIWHNTDICGHLREVLRCPVYLENNASCLARYNLGKPEARGSEDFLLLLVDSGVGSGIVSGGKLLKGAGYFTAELGHTTIHFRGRPCSCGNLGCLEAYAAVEQLLEGSPFRDWKQLMNALPQDKKAGELLALEAEYLAAGIVNLTHTVSIDTVLLAGDILYKGGQLAALLEQRVNSLTMRKDILPIRVLPSCTGKDTKLLAAADVAFGRFLSV